MDRLRFGPAGVPLSTRGRSTELGISRVAELGLGCMEMEFVHGVRMQEDNAASLKPLAKKSDIALTAHGPYYINLNSEEKKKRDASRERILRTARIGKLAGAWSITFHAAFLMKKEPSTVQAQVRKQMSTIMDVLGKEKNNIWIRPETTGKLSQWGTLDQLLELSLEWPNVAPCVDFAHLQAYSNGTVNSYGQFTAVLDKIEASLGKKALKDMHIHVSGIEFGPRGEKMHLEFSEADFKYKDLLRALRDYEVAGCVICESPILEKDAALLKRTYEEL